MILPELPDPRRWPAIAPTPAAATLHADVDARLAAASMAKGEALDTAIDARLAAWLREGDGEALANALASAPSSAIARHLQRRLAVAEADVLRGRALAAVLFALPVVVVAGAQGNAAVDIPGVLPDARALAADLVAQGLPLASARFALAPSLTAASALDPARLPALLAHARGMLDAAGPVAPLDLDPASIRVEGARERAHLRFLVGTAVSGPAADPFAAPGTANWGVAAARALSAVLAVPGAAVLALPRPPQRLALALPAGRAAQREVALQLFVAGALRELRSRYGEPVAVISAHEASDAPGGGELRLSLSSPLDERSAQGFRFPLASAERVADGVDVIATLLADCRVGDVRAWPRVEPGRDAATGLLRFARLDDDMLH